MSVCTLPRLLSSPHESFTCSEITLHSSRGKLRPCPLCLLLSRDTDMDPFTQRLRETATGDIVPPASWHDNVGLISWCRPNVLAFVVFCVLRTHPLADRLLTAGHGSTLVAEGFSIPYRGSLFLLGVGKHLASPSCLFLP